jgi:hypothetical protein
MGTVEFFFFAWRVRNVARVRARARASLSMRSLLVRVCVQCVSLLAALIVDCVFVLCAHIGWLTWQGFSGFNTQRLCTDDLVPHSLHRPWRLMHAAPLLIAPPLLVCLPSTA